MSRNAEVIVFAPDARDVIEPLTRDDDGRSAKGMTWDRIISAAATKRSDRGAFDDLVFLEFVEKAAD
jgi:hypothetical protein